jgi:hypothetical protein
LGPRYLTFDLSLTPVKLVALAVQGSLQPVDPGMRPRQGLA